MMYDYFAQRLSGSQPSPPLNQWGEGGRGEGEEGGERERDPRRSQDLIHRLAVRSYKECLEHTANYVRTVYRKKIELRLSYTIFLMKIR